MGEASGLQSCGSLAWSAAENKGVIEAYWGYVCCMKAHGSECYEKHR